MAKIIRIHGDTFTQDVKVIGKGPLAPQKEAAWALRDGCWVDNILYPSSRIVMVELRDV